jgi:hypothetical protein
MATFREWVARFLGTLRRGRADADLEQELRLHLELAAEEERGRTSPPENAGRAAVVRFGAIAQTMEALRDQRGVPWLDDLSRDVRHGLCMLCRNPQFTLIALLTLAIGIGATSAVFSVVNSVLLEPLPYPDADQLVAVWHTAPGASGLSTASGDLRLSASKFFTYAENNRSFQRIGLWFSGSSAVISRPCGSPFRPLSFRIRNVSHAHRTTWWTSCRRFQG